MAANTEQQAHPGLAVIIPYYDGAQFIERCVHSIFEGKMLPQHLYVVDNDPTGLSPQLFASSTDAVTVLRASPGIGFGRAVNVGVSAAIQDGCTIFLVLNQDTRVDTLCLSSMVDSHTSTRRPSLITAMSHGYDSNTVSPHFVQFVLKEQTSYFEDLARDALQQHYTLTRVGAACILFDKHLHSLVGLFDPLFHMYGEDNDLCMRIRNAGGELLLDTRAHIYHYHSLISEDGENMHKINSWLAISRILLRIRYTGLSRSGYILRSMYYFLKSIFKPSLKSHSPFIFLYHIPRILSQWHALKSLNPDQIKNRIAISVAQDRL